MIQPNQSPQRFPNAWAAEWGEDIYGLWQALIYKEVHYVFRWIGAGDFLMGSPENEPERQSHNEVQHKVILTEGFWLGETTVTQALWQAVMGGNPSYWLAVMGGNPSYSTDDDRNPVNRMNWNESKAFIQKLDSSLNQLERPHTENASLILRLPFEAEWEYACRAGTTSPFSFGDNITTDLVNYRGNYPYNGAKQGEFRNQPVKVKHLPCNDWGVYEMHGNVWEWCEDWYQENLGKEMVTNPIGAKAGTEHVARGGSWDYDGGHVRSAIRSHYSSDGGYYGLGLRLALGQSSTSLLK